MTIERSEKRTALEAEGNQTCFDVDLSQRQGALQRKPNDRLVDPLSSDGMAFQINTSELYGDKCNMQPDSRLTPSDSTLRTVNGHHDMVDRELDQLAAWLKAQGYPLRNPDMPRTARYDQKPPSEEHVRRTMKIANQLPEYMRQSFLESHRS